MRFLCHKLLTAIFLIGFTANLSAQLISVQNADFDFEAVTSHRSRQIPDHWSGNTKAKKHVRKWSAPGTDAVSIANGASLSQTVLIPELDEKFKSVPWRVILAIDVIGKSGNSKTPSQFWASIENEDGKELARKSFEVVVAAAKSKVTTVAAGASSFKAGNGLPEFAFDGKRKTIWHSDWGRNTPRPPHHLTLSLGKSRKLRGFIYAPRLDGGNGTVQDFELQVTTDGESWKQAFKGKFTYSNSGDPQTVMLPKPIKCRGVRLLCLSSIRGGPWASCSEFRPILDGDFEGLTRRHAKVPRDSELRFFVPLDFGQSQNLRRATVKIGADANAVVVDRVQLFRAPKVANLKMRGKPNGQLGPDLLGAGSFGLNALMIHQYPAIPLIKIQKNSPASESGLKKTDLIVGINDRFLPPGDLAPGFQWLKNSHESLLGNAILDALAEPIPTVRVKVLRQDEVAELDLKIDLPGELHNIDFFRRPSSSSQLTEDLIRHISRTQLSNGSWKKNPIHTCLGGLALLATGDRSFAPQIKSAANWLMAHNAEPGTGWYWHPAFSGIFLCEYYLATGDQRTLPVIERLLRMMGSTYHTSKWGTLTFGHGPRGLPYQNKSLVAVMVHVLVFEALAKRCGVESDIFETLEPYLDSAWSDPSQGGHGGMGYNASYKDKQEFWSRTGLFALALHLRNSKSKKIAQMAKIMHQRHPWFRNSHAYGEPGGLLGLIGLSQVHPEYFADVLSQYRWWFALAWENNKGLHFTIPHMGAPYMEGPVLINNGYGVVTQIHKKTLQITGTDKRDWLDVSEIPIPVSDVMITQNPKGDVNLRCRIPGLRSFTRQMEPNLTPSRTSS